MRQPGPARICKEGLAQGHSVQQDRPTDHTQRCQGTDNHAPTPPQSLPSLFLHPRCLARDARCADFPSFLFLPAFGFVLIHCVWRWAGKYWRFSHRVLVLKNQTSSCLPAGHHLSGPSSSCLLGWSVLSPLLGAVLATLSLPPREPEHPHRQSYTLGFFTLEKSLYAPLSQVGKQNRDLEGL